MALALLPSISLDGMTPPSLFVREVAVVLLVEDEAVSRRALQMLLALHGHSVKAVGSAEEGLDAIREGSEPNVAVIDVNLPGMSGVEFRRLLRQVWPNIQCIFMSANDEVNLERVGATFHESALRKPFELASLLKAMAPLLNSSKNTCDIAGTQRKGDFLMYHPSARDN
jgi:CheY-like chemotaxis protein